MKNFGKFMTILITVIMSSIINGFVIMKLWTWFIVPIFETNPLRMVEATTGNPVMGDASGNLKVID